MGNGNTRPQQGPTKEYSEVQELVRFKHQPGRAITPPNSNQRVLSQGPTTLDASSPTHEINKGCLVAPSSNPGPPRIVFSASLERTLNSRKRSAFSSSSSWTAAPLENDASSRSLSSRQQSDGEEVTGGLAKATHGERSTPRSTGEDKATGKRQWKGFGSHHKHQSSGLGRNITKSLTVSCPRDLDPVTKAEAPATAAVADVSRHVSREEGVDQPRRRHLRTRWGRPKQQDPGDSSSRKGGEASRLPRGGSAGDKLPMVKCWEGRAEKEGDGVEEKTPRRTVVRGQSNAETSVRRPGITNLTTAAEGRSSGKVESSSSARVSTGERVDVGRAFTERAPTRYHRGNGEGRSTRDDLATTDDDERLGAKIAPLQLPLSEDTYDCEGNLSLSSASSVAAQGVSVSLLPLMGTATTVATDLIFEDSSFEDSGSSAALASSSERNALDIGDVGGAGGSGDGATIVGGAATRRKRGGPGPRQRTGSVDAFVRTRSMGRGLSNLKARIHEQEESKGKDNSVCAPVLRDRRSSSRERFKAHELSDSDDGSPGAVAAVTPLTVTTPWAAATPAASTLNIGHQRAALELRNLALEREVEQLKTHLQNMGGDGIDRQRQGLHRPRPRPKRTGEQAMAHRLVAPLPLSEPARSIPRRSGAGSSWAGAAHGTTRDKAQPDRANFPSGNHRGGGRDSVGTNPHTGRSAPAQTTLVEDSRAHAVQSSPSPPRRYGHRPSDVRPSAGTVMTVVSVEPGSSSPARQLRAELRGSKLSSPEPTSQGMTVGLFISSSNVNAGQVGQADQAGQGGTGRGGRLDKAAARQTDYGTIDRAASDLGRTQAQEAPRIYAESRPLPRLRAEGVERRRGALKKARASKTPIYLGGVVSGIRHTFLGRRRSTGAIPTQNVAPAESYSVKASAAGAESSDNPGPSSRKTKRKGEVHEAPVNTVVVDTPRPVPVEDRASAKQVGEDEKARAPRRPPRGEDSPLTLAASTTMAAAASDASAIAPVNDRQQGREELAGPERARGGEGGVREDIGTPPPEANVINTAADRTIGVCVPISTPPTETIIEDVETSTPTAGSEDVATAAPVTAVTGSAEACEKAPARGRWPATLDARWAEVEFMLCQEVGSEESLQHTIEATEAGLVFMDKLERKAQELGVLKGQLSRWLLPFNADTSVDEQQAATPRRFQESLQASSASFATGDGVLTEEEAEYLTAGARKVRQLIRLKIADDNDLNTAKEALVAMAGFFVSISEEAERRGGSATAFGVLQERRAMSPITRPAPLPSVFRPTMEASATTDAQKAHGIPAPATANTTANTTATATTTATKRRTDAPTATGRRPPSLIPGPTKAAVGETSGEMLAQGEPTIDLTPAVEARHPEGSNSNSPPPATTAATLSTSRVETSVRNFPTAHTEMEATPATAATSEAGTAVVPSASATSSVIPSVESTDSPPRDIKKAEGGGSNGGEKAGGSIRQGRGDRSYRPTGAVAAGAAATMAASSPADAPDGDSSEKKDGALTSAREHGSGCGVGEVVGVAPPGSLVRLKKRRQQARTRSSNPR